MRDEVAPDDISFGAELAGLASVFAISLLGPWGDDGVGWGFYLAAFVLCITAFIAGRRPHWRESLLTGAAVGFLGTAVYMLGSVLAYEMGWYGRSGDDLPHSFIESDASAGSIFLEIVIYSVPAGAVGAVLAGTGHFAVDRWGGA